KSDNVTLLVNSEVEEVEGYIGNFNVKIKQEPQLVDPDKCNLCDDCTEACPVLVPDEHEEGLAWRKAIYIPFPQAIPATFTIDEDNCLGLDPIACGKCKDVCEAEAINYDAKPEIIEEEVGAIIVATGYDLYPVENLAEYGYGKYPDVITSLQFERILSATGPTGGEVRRPSDGKIPEEVAFIHCCGSRDPDRHLPYCSKICCMYSTKHAKLYKHKVPEGQPYNFYIDIRSGGKQYEEFVQNSQEEEELIFIRGKVARIYQDNDKMIIRGTDTLSGESIELEADMVVLAMGIQPTQGTDDLAQKLKLNTDENGFMVEAHPKLRPVESIQAGFFLAGTTQGPKDIPETVSQASGAAAKALALLSSDEIFHSPIIATVDTELCSGCGICVATCPYDARERNEAEGIVEVNEILCEGCGACISACPSNASQQKNLTDLQISDMIKIVASK
ncbi:MAG TPA: CoB--CoM heterodisulfide reductase iron-sulfur subunit A family protein, partial [bacterium]|nr:CoB--CoM heterodisulfide reductase iron-sulfur subunit A family protein [bacterium]